MANPKIELERVTHEFASGVRVLSDISFQVAPGEFVAIIGPSGSGKSTILNLISGLLQPTVGVVKVEGVPVQGIQARKIGYMFARDCLLPWKTALENATFGLEIQGKANREQKGLELLNSVGLAGFEHVYRGQLSQGMRQRVALARTLACEPEILLMDEPFAALDAQTRISMSSEFLRLWAQRCPCVVWVTHDLAEAILLADRILVTSHRPASIKGVYPVPFARPRSALELSTNPDYQVLLRRLWTDLMPETAHEESH